MGRTLRRLTASDLGRADEILQSAFGFPESREQDLRHVLALQPDGWFLALSEETAAGMAGAVDYGPFAYVGFMAVHQEAQRRGLGSFLMEHLIHWLDQRGTPMILLDATDAGAGLYAHFGFAENDHACLFQHLDHAQKAGALPGIHPDILPDILPDVLPGVRPLLPEDLPALFEFDASIFGADRRRVLLSLMADFPKRAFCLRDSGGELSGFVLAQDRQIGPWTARGPEEAEALLLAALTLPFNGPPQVVIPGMNPAGMELLDRSGFRLMRSTRHMRRGGAGLLTRRDLVYGQTSFAIG